MIHKISTLLILFFCFASVSAQQSLNAAGGSKAVEGGSISYSVGQIGFRFHSDMNGSVSAGVQQTYNISVVTETEVFKNIALLLSVFPNPASDYLILEVGNMEFCENNSMDLVFKLIDVNGKLLQWGKVLDAKTIIDVCRLEPAVYFVTIIGKKQKYSHQESNRDELIKTFKVVKTN
jgi:hypothetical protein